MDSMRTPSWDDLQYLMEAVRHGSLSAGARALGVDHATIGRRIRRLEKTLGRPVIDRQRPGLSLTAFGEAALTEAERMRDAAATVARLAARGRSWQAPCASPRPACSRPATSRR